MPPEDQRSQSSNSTPQGRGKLVGIVGILTIVVAVFGYLREASLAVRFGISATIDAYFGAIFIPNILYVVLVTGTLSPVLVPILLSDSAKGDEEASDTFSAVVTFIMVVLVAAAGLGVLTARLWLPVLFSGFSSSTLNLTVRLLYIILPALVFLGLSGILASTLNAYHRFAMAAFAPAVSSMVIIASVLLAPERNGIYLVGFATAFGFLLQFLILIPSVAALGIRYQPTFKFGHPAILKLLRLGVPLCLYLTVSNASNFIERNLASQISTGAVATLSYALRLFLVPANFLATPLATVGYPHFAREALRDKFGNLGVESARMFRLVVFLFLPAMLWVMLNALPITRLVYEHGRFSPADAVQTARVLSIYSLGILPYAIAMIALRALYAIQDTTTALWVEIGALIYFTAMATLLTRRLGFDGLIFSRSTTFVLVGFTLFVVLMKRLDLLRPSAETLSFLARTTLASLAMAAVSWAGLRWLQPAFQTSTMMNLAFVALQLCFCAVTYLGLSALLKLKEAKHAFRMLNMLLSRARPGMGE